jgi:uncharacterized repeat protein (TIGR03837 family)
VPLLPLLPLLPSPPAAPSGHGGLAFPSDNRAMDRDLRWDLFCRVIDNHGDLGVCWRLACDLASRGHSVRLWVDDPTALSWMAPQGADRVTVHGWTEMAPDSAVDIVGDGMGDVVVEAFGCDPPPAFVQAMARRPHPPVWVNLEYLSAEAWVERSHGLPSPTPSGLTKWFFFTGFTDRTGGLLREPALMREQQQFDGRAWLAQRGWPAQEGERVVSLFCYRQPRLADWLAQLADAPTLLLATPGPATQQLQALMPPSQVRVVALPWLTQQDYDRLLWSCDLNAVRGEDSFVRALWADAPMLWQIYPQHDGVHAGKLQAFIDRYVQGMPGGLAPAVRAAQLHWNGLAGTAPGLPDLRLWRQGHRAFRSTLLAQDDLGKQLCCFVGAKRLQSGG